MLTERDEDIIADLDEILDDPEASAEEKARAQRLKEAILECAGTPAATSNWLLAGIAVVAVLLAMLVAALGA